MAERRHLILAGYGPAYKKRARGAPSKPGATAGAAGARAASSAGSYESVISAVSCTNAHKVDLRSPPGRALARSVHMRGVMAQSTTPYRPARRARGWASASYIGDLWAQLRRDALALPREAWRRWLRVTLIGLALSCAFAAGLTLLARRAAPRGLQAWDEAVLPQIIAGAPFSFSAAGMIETPGNLVGMLLLLVPAVVLAVRSGRPLIVASLLSLYWLGTAVLWAGWLLWDRARPELVAGGIAAPGLHSFPSGHILHVVCVYGFLAYLWCRAAGGWLERALAVVLCAALVVAVIVSRLVLGTHWPSDTLAGALIGLVWLAVAIVALRRAEAA